RARRSRVDADPSTPGGRSAARQAPDRRADRRGRPGCRRGIAADQQRARECRISARDGRRADAPRAREPSMKIALTINGEARELAVEPYRSLLDVLRNEAGLTGTKKGCDVGDCGACTVLVDDRSEERRGGKERR